MISLSIIKEKSMNISDMIKQLEELKAKWGDIEVCTHDRMTYGKPWLTVNKISDSKNVVAVN